MPEHITLPELAMQVNNLEKLIDIRFQAQEKAVAAALAAQEKYNQATAEASKEAILKAEMSQKGVNERGNEFRGQLADQAATLMPRKESEAAINSLREIWDREMNTIRASIENLKVARSQVDGRGQGLNAFWGYLVGAIGTIAAVITVVFLLVR